MTFVAVSSFKATFWLQAVPKLASPEPPTEGDAQKGGPVNSQYVVLFTQRMIKVP